MGARVIATSSSSAKLEMARKLGATDLINYRENPNWSEEVMRLTNNEGADLVSDVVGWDTIEQSVACLKPGGTVAIVGMLSAPQNVEIMVPLLLGGKNARGILTYSKTMLEEAVRLAEEHNLSPHVGHVFAWKDAAQAFDQMRKQNFVGKIVIKVD
jgi:NADPH:quinone reductase-like Zn-dependent oxidoreductase